MSRNKSLETKSLGGESPLAHLEHCTAVFAVCNSSWWQIIPSHMLTKRCFPGNSANLQTEHLKFSNCSFWISALLGKYIVDCSLFDWKSVSILGFTSISIFDFSNDYVGFFIKISMSSCCEVQVTTNRRCIRPFVVDGNLVMTKGN